MPEDILLTRSAADAVNHRKRFPEHNNWTTVWEPRQLKGVKVRFVAETSGFAAHPQRQALREMAYLRRSVESYIPEKLRPVRGDEIDDIVNWQLEHGWAVRNGGVHRSHANDRCPNPDHPWSGWHGAPRDYTTGYTSNTCPGSIHFNPDGTPR